MNKGQQKDCFETLHNIFIYIYFNEVLYLWILIDIELIPRVFIFILWQTFCQTELEKSLF